MSEFRQLFTNGILLTAVASWAIAQLIKMLIDFGMSGRLTFERLTGAGGMPSSHSATVCGLTMITLLVYGTASFEFAVTFILAIIVMYDARGVRRETGKQAVILNDIVEYLSNPLNPAYKDPDFSQQKLKELVGHTPLQVFFGAVIGILTALVSYNFFIK